MKYNWMLTKETTKYWKKAIKNDRVMVANVDDFLYIVNGYNAFRVPAYPLFWEELARPAFMIDMPEDGKAVQFMRGEKTEYPAQDVKNLFERVVSVAEKPVQRTPLQFDAEKGTTRIYRHESGQLTFIMAKYDSMIDFAQVDKIASYGVLSPIVCKNATVAAVLMPIRVPDDKIAELKELFS